MGSDQHVQNGYRVNYSPDYFVGCDAPSFPPRAQSRFFLPGQGPVNPGGNAYGVLPFDGIGVAADCDEDTVLVLIVLLTPELPLELLSLLATDPTLVFMALSLATEFATLASSAGTGCVTCTVVVPSVPLMPAPTCTSIIVVFSSVDDVDVEDGAAE